MMDKIQIGDCEVREDLLYAYLQAIENVGDPSSVCMEGVDTWRLDTERAICHYKMLKSLGLVERGKDGKREYYRNRKKYKEFADALSIWLEKQIEKDRRTLDGNFRQ